MKDQVSIRKFEILCIAETVFEVAALKACQLLILLRSREMFKEEKCIMCLLVRTAYVESDVEDMLRTRVYKHNLVACVVDEVH